MEDGTIVHVDYDLYNAETSDVSRPVEKSQEHEKHQEVELTSIVCAVGAGTLIAGFEDAV